MLLTLNAKSIQARLTGPKRNQMRLEEVPRLAKEQLGLRGLVIDTSLLKGWSLDRLDALRDQADQDGCPWLVLRESTPVDVTGTNVARQAKTSSRIHLVARAGHRLGCNAISLRPAAFSGEQELATASAFLRRVMERMDRLELNLLIEPGEGDIAQPAGLIELIKKVGGFRIGTMPNFANACDGGDPTSALRQTAPYAGAVLASCGRIGIKSLIKKERDQLRLCVEALTSVGYEQILAIDYLGQADAMNIVDAARAEIEAVLSPK